MLILFSCFCWPVVCRSLTYIQFAGFMLRTATVNYLRRHYMANSTSNKTAASANESASPLTEKAASAAHQAVDAMSSKAANAEETIRKTAAGSSEALHQRQEQIKHQLESGYQRTRSLAAENPLAAAGIAFAAGVLVTALLRRGR
jgi:ElaB/YqjD/DUF883 family membrane-anchored ribosome-binding protein